MNKRKLLLGTNAFFVTLFCFGIVVLVYKLADRHHLQLDLSVDSRHQLSLEMYQVLERIDREDKPIEVIAFTAQEGRRDARERNRYVQDLLRQLERHSSNLKWQLIDYDQERYTAEQLGVQEHGRIVVLQGEERVDIKERLLFKRGKGADGKVGLHFLGEEELLRGFTTLLNNEVRKMYVVTGHGELSIQDTGPAGLSSWKRALERSSFDVKPLNLLSVGKVPDDTDVLIVPQPKQALSASEQDVLLNYISRGGGLIFAYKGTQELALFRQFQVRLLDGVATDTTAQFPYWDRPIVTFGSHEIVDEIRSASLPVVVSASAAYRGLSNNITGIVQKDLFALSNRGWLERGGDFLDGNAVYQEGVDSKETGALAIAIEIFPGSKLLRSGVEKSRVVLLGDSEWFSNALLNEISGNRPLINNMIEWATGDGEMLQTDLSARKTAGELLITKPQLATIRWVALLPLPSLVFGIGFLVWYSRRGR